MNVAMMQPAFLPWQGFFELLCKADKFIILDDFQFSIQSYHQRNRLFISKGKAGWYTVPVVRSVSFKAPLDRVKIDESIPWRAKMWTRIRLNYSRAPYYRDVAPWIEEWLLSRSASLAEQNISFIRYVSQLLGFGATFDFSSDHAGVSQRSDRVVGLLRLANATRYFCARGSFDYMYQDGIFPVSGIEVLFQDFIPRPYRQIGAAGDFVPSLSVLDAIMNVGPYETAELVKNGTGRWRTWGEMVADVQKSGVVKIHET